VVCGTASVTSKKRIWGSTEGPEFVMLRTQPRVLLSILRVSKFHPALIISLSINAMTQSLQCSFHIHFQFLFNLDQGSRFFFHHSCSFLLRPQHPFLPTLSNFISMARFTVAFTTLFALVFIANVQAGQYTLSASRVVC
jgi:hypothetical protein